MIAPAALRGKSRDDDFSAVSLMNFLSISTITHSLDET
jgi:hypothetical protein